jgi:hypothetical protein
VRGDIIDRCSSSAVTRKATQDLLEGYHLFFTLYRTADISIIRIYQPIENHASMLNRLVSICE